MANKKEKPMGYKLRDSRTGLYLASGGRWTKMGKVWPRSSDAIRMINRMLKRASVKKWSKDLKTKDEIVDDLSNYEVVELYEKNSYPILFHADKIRR